MTALLINKISEILHTVQRIIQVKTENNTGPYIDKKRHTTFIHIQMS